MKKVVHITKGKMGGLDYITKKIITLLTQHYHQEVLYFDSIGYEIYSGFERQQVGTFEIKEEVIFVNPIKLFIKMFFADAIHIHHTKIWLLTSPALLFPHKIVFTFHLSFGVAVKKNIIQNFLILLIINYCSLFSRKVVFLTNGQKNHLLKYSLFKKTLLKKAETISNFIDSELVLSSRDKFNSEVLFIGRYTKIKGFEDLMGVCRELKHVNFFLIGENDLGQKSTFPNLKNYGVVKNNEIPDYLDRHSIFILPSYTEAFPLSILEAMSRGMVILVSRLPGMDEIIIEGENGYLFNPGNLKEISEILDFLYRNPAEIKRISSNNLLRARYFTDEVIMSRYLSLYEGIN